MCADSNDYSVRLVSYNILDGGEGRADPLAEILLAQQADIVCLVESDQAPTLERVADRLKMDCIHAPGNKSSAALLSRWPINETINHALLRGGLEKSFLEARVSDPAGMDWIVAVAHLHARAREMDEQQREREIAIVLDALRDHRDANRPHLLAGDFNSVAPYQKIDPEKCKPSTRKAWQENGGKLPRRVIQKILDAGYLDTLAVVDPVTAKSAGTFSTQYPGQRVDFIFAFGLEPKKTKKAWIEYDRLARYASDHFPIGAEFS